MEKILGEKEQKVIGLCVNLGPGSAPIPPLFSAHRFISHINGSTSGKTQCLGELSVDVLQPQLNRRLSVYNSSGMTEDSLRKFVSEVDSRFSMTNSPSEDARLLPVFQEKLRQISNGPNAIILEQSLPWGYTAFGCVNMDLYPVFVYNDRCIYVVITNIVGYDYITKSVHGKEFFFHRLPVLNNSSGIIFTYRIASRLGRYRQQQLPVHVMLAALEDLIIRSTL